MLIGQFEASAPQYVRSPQTDDDWKRNGVIDTSEPVEVGEMERIKGGWFFPLRFKVLDHLGNQSEVEVWYGAELRHTDSVLHLPDSQDSIRITEV